MKLQACVACGNKIPEKQNYPFVGHEQNCSLKKEWMKKMTGKELAKQLSQFVNIMANAKEEDEFVEAIMREHRTLQQSTFKLVMKLIVAWAETGDDFYDLRNEYTVLQCKEILDKIPELRYNPPFI